MKPASGLSVCPHPKCNCAVENRGTTDSGRTYYLCHGSEAHQSYQDPDGRVGGIEVHPVTKRRQAGPVETDPGLFGVTCGCGAPATGPDDLCGHCRSEIKALEVNKGIATR